MRRLPLTYGFKGPERQDVLRKSMIAHTDKVFEWLSTSKDSMLSDDIFTKN